ncbi:MAG: hypothetical protein SF053_18470 [Bacteroidia bacterium]|nr:hypothetical protein [Bacteroidia bacterium]
MNKIMMAALPTFLNGIVNAATGIRPDTNCLRSCYLAGTDVA